MVDACPPISLAPIAASAPPLLTRRREPLEPVHDFLHFRASIRLHRSDRLPATGAAGWSSGLETSSAISGGPRAGLTLAFTL